MNSTPHARCDGRKVRHPSRDDADIHIASLQGACPDTTRAAQLIPYYCRSCRAWHVGHHTRFAVRRLEGRA